MIYKIRKATFEDAKGIAQVHIQSWRETYKDIIEDEYLRNLDLVARIKSWEEDLKNPKKTEWTFVVEDTNKNIVGFISGGRARGHYADEFEGELYAIYILKKYQKNKFGLKLIKKLCSTFRSQGINNMFVCVLQDNVAKNFYIKYGAQLLAVTEEKTGKQKLTEEYYGWQNFDDFLG